jgi:hypothetical protein
MTRSTGIVRQIRIAASRVVLPVIVSGVLLGVSAKDALSHESRIVANGKYEMVCGFRNEPAFEGEINAVDIFPSRASDGKPIDTSVGDVVDLTVVVQYRAAESFNSAVVTSTQLDQKPTKAFGTANRYNAWFRPNVDGAYAFRITGTISDLSNPVAGQVTIDETFVCGGGSLVPGHGFNCVQDAQPFPNKPGSATGK